jgi:tRNA pseudouridine32 synthase / 23S rRNA pseudouridine746 synthase
LYLSNALIPQQLIQYPVNKYMHETDSKKEKKALISPNYFHSFQADTEGVALPDRFTFPFNYTPHRLSLWAAKELQDYIQTQQEWSHNFGLDGKGDGLGKMFGVLVVQNQQQALGYLAAFSGKLADSNHHTYFVPPVFDVFEPNGAFRNGEAEINHINQQIEDLENAENLKQLKAQLHAVTQQSQQELLTQKEIVKKAKAHRDTQRQTGKETLLAAELDVLETTLNNQSSKLYYQLKDLSRAWQRKLDAIQAQIDVLLEPINALKEARKKKSGALQQVLFDNYTFLNQAGEVKNLAAIFCNDIQPPAGAGECAAPKLLQNAFMHKLKPIALAEFWWGQSPSSEIRKHGLFYPACKSKCEPILGHMLSGMRIEDNPVYTAAIADFQLETIYEDDYLLIVNKPAEMLSVPGKKVDDSVYSRIKKQYPLATGPMIVHRLDMSTSGLLVIAKTKEVHQQLQNQFLKKTVKKRYAAILEGIMAQDEGTITLPLRVDLDNRPHQLVCYEHGKYAQTMWKVVKRMEKYTHIHFFPITGRTHQLRVHAAHPFGLNMPIMGDELYGTRADRLYLHAESIEFDHPISHERVHFEIPTAF